MERRAYRIPRESSAHLSQLPAPVVHVMNGIGGDDVDRDGDEHESDDDVRDEEGNGDGRPGNCNAWEATLTFPDEIWCPNPVTFHEESVRICYFQNARHVTEADCENGDRRVVDRVG